MNTTFSHEFVGEDLNKVTRVTVLALGWLAWTSGVFGNSFIALTLLSQRALRSAHTIYIANLALSDLVLVGYIMTFWLLDLTRGQHPVLNAQHCIVNASVTCSAFSSSVLTLVTISVNRYLTVCHHHLFIRVFTRQRTFLSCAFIWATGLLTCLPNIALAENGSSCYFKKIHLCRFLKNEKLNIYSIIHLNILLTLPLLVIGICNRAIIRHWAQSKSRLGQWRKVESAKQERTSQRQFAVPVSDKSVCRFPLTENALLRHECSREHIEDAIPNANALLRHECSREHIEDAMPNANALLRHECSREHIEDAMPNANALLRHECSREHIEDAMPNANALLRHECSREHIEDAMPNANALLRHECSREHIEDAIPNANACSVSRLSDKRPRQNWFGMALVPKHCSLPLGRSDESPIGQVMIFLDDMSSSVNKSLISDENFGGDLNEKCVIVPYACARFQQREVDVGVPLRRTRSCSSISESVEDYDNTEKCEISNQKLKNIEMCNIFQHSQEFDHSEKYSNLYQCQECDNTETSRILNQGQECDNTETCRIVHESQEFDNTKNWSTLNQVRTHTQNKYEKCILNKRKLIQTEANYERDLINPMCFPEQSESIQINPLCFPEPERHQTNEDQFPEQTKYDQLNTNCFHTTEENQSRTGWFQQLNGSDSTNTVQSNAGKSDSTNTVQSKAGKSDSTNTVQSNAGKSDSTNTVQSNAGKSDSTNTVQSNAGKSDSTNTVQSNAGKSDSTNTVQSNAGKSDSTNTVQSNAGKSDSTNTVQSNAGKSDSTNTVQNNDDGRNRIHQFASKGHNSPMNSFVTLEHSDQGTCRFSGTTTPSIPSRRGSILTAGEGAWSKEDCKISCGSTKCKRQKLMRSNKRNDQAPCRLDQGSKNHTRANGCVSLSETSLFRSLLTIFTCSFVLYMPLSIVTLVNVRYSVSSNVFIWTILCVFLNHSINWLVYGLTNPEIRRGCRRQLDSFWRRLWCLETTKAR